MKSKHIVLSAFLVLCSLFFVAGRANAQTCTDQYGGTVACAPTDLVINKVVAVPTSDSAGRMVPSGTFVENLGTGQLLIPGAEVLFRLTVKNASGETFNPVTVRDVLPPYLTFVSGPGSFDAASRTLTIRLENMIAGESRSMDVLTRVLPANQWPAGQNVQCAVNAAEVRALSRFDDDTAQVCFAAALTLPVAGYNDLLLLLPFAGVGLSGLVLLKKRG